MNLKQGRLPIPMIPGNYLENPARTDLQTHRDTTGSDNDVCLSLKVGIAAAPPAYYADLCRVLRQFALRLQEIQPRTLTRGRCYASAVVLSPNVVCIMRFSYDMYGYEVTGLPAVINAIVSEPVR